MSTGVEHTELASTIIDALGGLGLSTSEIAAFIGDGASVVAAAVRSISHFFPKARVIVCLAHTLNNIAKTILNASGFKEVSDFFLSARAYVNPKLHVARCRRWFAFLAAEGKRHSVPPKWVITQWTVWRQCGEWWCEHIELWQRWVELEWSRMSPKEQEKSVQTKTMKESLLLSKREFIVRMAFAVDHMQEFATVINVLQSRGKAVAMGAAVHWASLFQSFKDFATQPQWSPRVLEALKGMPTSTLEALKHAIRNMVAAFEVQTVKHKATLNFFESLQVASLCVFPGLWPPPHC